MFDAKYLFKVLLASLLFIALVSPVVAAARHNTHSVVGYWQTIDGKTHKPSSIIKITQQGQVYNGKIIKTYNKTRHQKIQRCNLCKGAQYNKPIIGLEIIAHMVCIPGYCSHGTILDPRSGKVYHAKMQLIHQGAQLKVRGYVGVPMFGKTVIWNRVTEKSLL